MSSRVIKSRKKYLTPAGLSVCTRVTIGLVKNWKYKDKIKINKIKKIKEKKNGDQIRSEPELQGY